MLEVSARVHYASTQIECPDATADCACLTILPSCSKSQVCKRRRLQSGSFRTGAFEMRSPLFFHVFSTDSQI